MNRSVTLFVCEIVFLLVDILLDLRSYRCVLEYDCTVLKLLYITANFVNSNVSVFVNSKCNLCNYLITDRSRVLFNCVFARLEINLMRFICR